MDTTLRVASSHPAGCVSAGTLEWYGLRDQPFAKGARHRISELDRTRRDALAALYLGVLSSRSLLTLLAPEGMGKTPLLVELAARLERAADVIVLSGPSVARGQLSALAARERTTGQRTVLVVDDAHELSLQVLEEIQRLLESGMPHDWLQVILAGPPSLGEHILAPSLGRLRQRQTLIPTLGQLSAAETMAYADHQLSVAGYPETTSLFTREAMARIADESDGVPGRIDEVCRRALALGAAGNWRSIGRPIVEEAIADIRPSDDAPPHELDPEVEEVAEPLPMAVGQGSMLLFPSVGAVGGNRAVPGPIAQLTPVPPSRPAGDPIVHAGPWRLHPAIEDAVRPSERRAPVPPLRRDPKPRSPSRPAAAPDTHRPVDVAESPAEGPFGGRDSEPEEEPLLAPLPPGTPATYTVPDSPQLSKLVANLLATEERPGARSIVFASVDQGRHTSRLCADVAKVIAAAGSSRVLVVDADRDSPELHEQFGRGPGPGLGEVFDDRVAWETVTIAVGPKLFLLSAGGVTRPGSFCLLPQQVAGLMSKLQARFDYVLINALPLDHGGDSIEFGRNADGVLLVVAAHATRREAAREAKEQLEVVGARVLGAVLTDRTFPVPDAIYRRL